METLAQRFSPAELTELASALPDETLAHLTRAVVRQLRRRLGRASERGKPSGRGRPSALERAVQEIVAELAESTGDDYDW